MATEGRSASFASSLPGRMVLSSFAGMGAATFCHPLDVLKVNLQVDAEGQGKRQYKNTLDAAIKIFRRDGLRRGLYAGLSAAYLRQWTYGSCRMGIYSFLLNHNKPADNSPVPFSRKLLFGSISGGIGAFAGTPSELALVRMAADNKKPAAERRGYKNVGDCLVRILKEEGLTNVWRGAGITIVRASVLSSCAMGVTSESKERLFDLGWFSDKNSIPMLFCSTVIASVIANAAAIPFDVIKSRLQNMPVATGGAAPLYSSALDCARKSVAGEGVLVLFRGYTPAFIKLAPYTTLSLIFLDRLSILATGKSAL